MSRTMTRISFLAVLLCSLPLGLLGQQPRLPMRRPYKPILGPAQTQQPQSDAGTAGDTATYISFDIPGPVLVCYETGINPAGVTTGYYLEPNLVSHGFLRASDGTVSTIDPPGSTGTSIGQYINGLAGPPINPAGAITGRYCDAAGCHGFLRAPENALHLSAARHRHEYPQSYPRLHRNPKTLWCLLAKSAMHQRTI